MGRFINADTFVSTGQGLLGNNMFAYCLNNPINCFDCNGNSAAQVQQWIVSMWWLPQIDTILFVGDIIYYGGIILLGLAALHASQYTTPVLSMEDDVAAPEIPDVTYPGDDPTQAPEGTEWKGKGEQGSSQGNYHNPETGESWHPDLNHPEPIGPHWDYRDSAGNWWRVGHGDMVTKK